MRKILMVTWALVALTMTGRSIAQTCEPIRSDGEPCMSGPSKSSIDKGHGHTEYHWKVKNNCDAAIKVVWNTRRIKGDNSREIPAHDSKEINGTGFVIVDSPDEVYNVHADCVQDGEMAKQQKVLWAQGLWHPPSTTAATTPTPTATPPKQTSTPTKGKGDGFVDVEPASTNPPGFVDIQPDQ